MLKLTVDSACEILTVLDAHQERIEYRGRRTTPYKLCLDEGDIRSRLAQNVTIAFKAGKTVRKGTLQDMVKERMKIKEEPRVRPQYIVEDVVGPRKSKNSVDKEFTVREDIGIEVPDVLPLDKVLWFLIGGMTASVIWVTLKFMSL